MATEQEFQNIFYALSQPEMNHVSQLIITGKDEEVIKILEKERFSVEIAQNFIKWAREELSQQAVMVRHNDKIVHMSANTFEMLLEAVDGGINLIQTWEDEDKKKVEETTRELRDLLTE